MAERLIIAGFFDGVISKVFDPLVVEEATSILSNVLQHRSESEDK